MEILNIDQILLKKSIETKEKLYKEMEWIFDNDDRLPRRIKAEKELLDLAESSNDDKVNKNNLDCLKNVKEEISKLKKSVKKEFKIDFIKLQVIRDGKIVCPLDRYGTKKERRNLNTIEKYIKKLGIKFTDDSSIDDAAKVVTEMREFLIKDRYKIPYKFLKEQILRHYIIQSCLIEDFEKVKI